MALTEIEKDFLIKTGQGLPVEVKDSTPLPPKKEEN
jgi:hypothetical protein